MPEGLASPRPSLVALLLAFSVQLVAPKQPLLPLFSACLVGYVSTRFASVDATLRSPYWTGTTLAWLGFAALASLKATRPATRVPGFEYSNLPSCRASSSRRGRDEDAFASYHAEAADDDGVSGDVEDPPGRFGAAESSSPTNAAASPSAGRGRDRRRRRRRRLWGTSTVPVAPDGRPVFAIFDFAPARPETDWGEPSLRRTAAEDDLGRFRRPPDEDNWVAVDQPFFPAIGDDDDTFVGPVPPRVLLPHDPPGSPTHLRSSA
mmetsp:Transcript_22585/g.89678  ORF Transcript_22585/g.89678 Transcript_22585/m.89678 type:complete len:263 (-) Transcript_22585:871-1659(-)